ncbi:hypothetical protein [Nocardia jiangxiensis]|uniref:Uncharacterized protein n=1 Tax=Nocardia jiangxiensis TaxID=282685 RepID=A0ABW6SB52_9NOCA|nr:hypothetical protein [Nocardia jiangxiensis]
MGSDNVVGDGRRARRRGARGAGVVAAVGAPIAGAVAASPSSVAESGSCGRHFVASWLASPTDAVTPVDASGGPAPCRSTIRPSAWSSLPISAGPRYGSIRRTGSVSPR